MAVIARSQEYFGLCPVGWLAGPERHVMKELYIQGTDRVLD